VARAYVDRHASFEHVDQLRVALAGLKAGETLFVPGIRITAVQPAERTRDAFTHTGVLMVRIRADTTESAREQLQQAADAALEAAPGIVAIESTNVSRNPKRSSRTTA
jgi:hypothetical protein